MILQKARFVRRDQTINRFVSVLTLLFAGLGGVRAALPAPDPDDGGLSLAPGFRALVVADNLGPIRFISVADSGDIYIKKQHNGLIALRDRTGTGRADTVKSFGDEFGSGTGVRVHEGWLYFSTYDA